MDLAAAVPTTEGHIPESSRRKPKHGTAARWLQCCSPEEERSGCHYDWYGYCCCQNDRERRPGWWTKTTGQSLAAATRSCLHRCIGRACGSSGSGHKSDTHDRISISACDTGCRQLFACDVCAVASFRRGSELTPEPPRCCWCCCCCCSGAGPPRTPL